MYNKSTQKEIIGCWTNIDYQKKVEQELAEKKEELGIFNSAMIVQKTIIVYHSTPPDESEPLKKSILFVKSQRSFFVASPFFFM
jgi:hypothetical protein